MKLTIYTLFLFIIPFYVSAQPNNGANECAFYVPANYAGEVIKFHVEDAFRKNKLSYRIIKTTYSKLSINEFKILLVAKPSTEPTHLASECESCPLVSVSFKNNNETLIISQVVFDNWSAIQPSTLESIKQGLQGQNINFGSLTVKDPRYVYINISSKVIILDKGLAIVSKQFENYFNATIEDLVIESLKQSGGTLSFILPISKLQDVWPPQENILKFNGGTIFIEKKKFDALVPQSLQAEVICKIDYKFSSADQPIKGENKYKLRVKISDDFRVQHCSLEIEEERNIIERGTVLGYFDRLKPSLESQLPQSDKTFFCDFILPKEKVMFRFKTIGGVIRDSNIFINLYTK